MILRLALRQTQGYIDSLFDIVDFPLTCPSYSQLSRRLQDLNIKTQLYQKQHNTQIENNDLVALTIDSTGLKRFGRDEWHREKHKVSRKCSW
ncbi:transposase [Vibrio mediterranei]|jgi:uncharacterized protein YpmS|uniref:transposase n=1 Tax=Vibrio mediterranei TaxID=689 RepID=UPI00229102F6|nr:transposase [Vibrio mediterranei]